MSKFHSVISRRDFMKGLGMAGAGLGAAAATAPVFHDIDEVASSSKAGWIRPWYIKEVDQPISEIDYSIMKRYNTGNIMRGSYNRRVSSQQNAQNGATSAANTAARFASSEPGYLLRDHALAGASHNAGYTYTGPSATTPEDRGVPRWSGTPEEGASILRTGFRLHGAATVTFTELTSNTEKLMYAIDNDRKRMDIVDSGNNHRNNRIHFQVHQLIVSNYKLYL